MSTFVRISASVFKNNRYPLANVTNDLLYVLFNFKNVDLMVLIGLVSLNPEDNHLILKIPKKVGCVVPDQCNVVINFTI